MTALNLARARLALAAAAIAMVAGAAGFGLANLQGSKTPSASSTPTEAKKPLYYFDPMVPAQHFDKPGKSPFMDMQLVPRYADSSVASGEATGVKVDPAIVQSLGVRLASVQRGDFAQSVDVTGVLDHAESRVGNLLEHLPSVRHRNQRIIGSPQQEHRKA